MRVKTILAIAIGLTPALAWGQSSPPPSSGRYAVVPIQTPTHHNGGTTWFAWRLNTETGELYFCMQGMQDDIVNNLPRPNQLTHFCSQVDGGGLR
jgi:hypothetical protein